MKGAIFIALSEMINENYGMDTWFELLDAAGLDGAYTSADTYPDEEALKLVEVTAAKLELSVEQTLRAFGEYLFTFLHASFPMFADSQNTFFDFIKSIESVIHVEVRKVDSEAITPSILVVESDADTALVAYQSERKLCHLAEGLLTGAALHYGIRIKLEQTACMHDGAEECMIKIHRKA